VTTIHQHNAPNYTGLAVVGAATLIIIVVLVWHGGVFLLDRAGSQDPEKDMSTAIISLLILLAVAGLGVYLFKLFIDRVCRAIEGITQTVMEARVEIAKANQLAAIAGAPAGRATDAQHRFAQAVILAMDEAYQIVARGGFSGIARPWSRRGVKALADSAGISIPETGAHSCDSIGPFLRRRGVITTGDQIDVNKFPGIASVKVMLEKEFNVPVKVNPIIPYSGGEV